MSLSTRFDRAPEVPPADVLRLRPSPVYETFWRFAAERQAIFFRRLTGQVPPWTENPVLRAFKFTNAYRASDRVSQYLIRNVIYRRDLPGDPTEIVFRTLLFKLFNRIDTWVMLEREVGPLTYADYSFDRHDRVLTHALSRGRRIYSAAYIMPAAGSFGYARKHRNHLRLLEQILCSGFADRLVDLESLQMAFELIRSYPTLGDFLAYQYAIDLNYSPVCDFTEMEFVVPGPGAIDGIRKCFLHAGDMPPADIIRLMADLQESEFARLGLEFASLWGRRLQLIDCQNLFCEVGKYARVAHPEVRCGSGRDRIKQRFRPSGEPLRYWYPPKWGINRAVAGTVREASAHSR